MKTVNFQKLIYGLLLVGGLFIISCKPDKEEDPNAPGPSTDARDKYVGQWLCNETSRISGNTSYTINISKSTSGTSDISIDHFYDLNAQARASVSGNSISIPYQQLGSIGFASGSGNLASTGTSLSMSYTTNVGGNKDTCTAVCTKQ